MRLTPLNATSNQQALENHIIVIQKLIDAFNKHDYSLLTLHDIIQLVSMSLLHPKTALRLAKEAGYVN